MQIDERQKSEEMVKIISFRAGEQEFSIEIMAIKEIRGWAEPTPLPHAPDYVAGLINLRGLVIPVIDIGLRLGLSATEPSERTAIIVTEVGSKLIGLLVEKVSDMLTVAKSDIQPVPDVSESFDKAFAQGIIALPQGMVCMLSLPAIFKDLDRQRMDEAA